MKTFIYYFILTSAIISSPLYAGMEQTDQCKREITRIEGEIKALKEEKVHLDTLKNNRNQWRSFPLIPDFLLQLKLKGLDAEIEKLTGKNIDKVIEEKNNELNEENAKLQSCRKITIRKIEVTAHGKWDADDSDPDIAIFIDHRKIDGVQDKKKHTFELNEDVTEPLYLKIYDADIALDDLMAKIRLEKFKNLKGIEGDWCEKTQNGRVDRKGDLVTTYRITYEVSF